MIAPAPKIHAPMLGMIQCITYAALQPYQKSPMGMRALPTNCIDHVSLRGSCRFRGIDTHHKRYTELWLSNAIVLRLELSVYAIIDGCCDLSAEKEAQPE